MKLQPGLPEAGYDGRIDTVPANSQAWRAALVHDLARSAGLVWVRRAQRVIYSPFATLSDVADKVSSQRWYVASLGATSTALLARTSGSIVCVPSDHAHGKSERAHLDAAQAWERPAAPIRVDLTRELSS